MAEERKRLQESTPNNTLGFNMHVPNVDEDVATYHSLI